MEEKEKRVFVDTLGILLSYYGMQVCCSYISQTVHLGAHGDGTLSQKETNIFPSHADSKREQILPCEAVTAFLILAFITL